MATKLPMKDSKSGKGVPKSEPPRPKRNPKPPQPVLDVQLPEPYKPERQNPTIEPRVEKPRAFTRCEGDGLLDYQTIQEWAITGYREALEAENDIQRKASRRTLAYHMKTYLGIYVDNDDDSEMLDTDDGPQVRMDGVCFGLSESNELVIYQRCQRCRCEVGSQPIKSRIGLGKQLVNFEPGEHTCKIKDEKVIS